MRLVTAFAATTRMAAALHAVRCGELACQRDSYARQSTATVLNVQLVQAGALAASQKKGKKPVDEVLYECTLSDTVLFPEGGGQPSDAGTVGGVDCLRVANVDGLPVHYLKGPLEIGSEVLIEVDWPRRWDLMTQHSAQHLVSAVALRDFGCETLSWNLGAETSFIEIASPFTAEQADALEGKANAEIRRGAPVEPSWHSAEDVKAGSVEGLRMSSCKLPDSVTGAVRVVSFSGLDVNTCCGTHVQTSSDLMCVKFVKCDAPDKKTKSLKLYFVAGDRVLSKLAGCVLCEQQIGNRLSAGPENLVARVDDALKQKDDLQRLYKVLTKDYVALEAARLAQAAQGKGIVHAHRANAADSGELAKALATAFEQSADKTLLLQTFGSGAEASFLLSGPADLLSAAKQAVATALDGKGGGKDSRYQGKCNRADNAPEALSAAEGALRAIRDASCL
ncbi:Threonyl/alanyl tRNA synthetase [Pelagophyceae sp. CCMP2097]|nr:Threonyl/alanyl tRNA synthetase [Pelagophyceae sp. CCMP2097]